MDEGVFEALTLVAVTLICIGLAYAVHKMEAHRNESISRAEKLRDDIGLGLQGMVENMSNLDIDVPDIDIIRETIEDAIQGIMGQMHVPTGQDMILGAISQLVMSKVVPQMPEGLQNIAAEILPPPIENPEKTGPD